MSYSFFNSSSWMSWASPGKDQTGKNHDEFEIDKEQLNQLILELFYIRED
ncbi:hypothetical protein [Faecalicoccus pleomorphus]|nr:hypothetical protein [Faecalicoccus pleomorphus]MBM6809374.1 hypothetical protein [Faecalicoccus pleomorphus]